MKGNCYTPPRTDAQLDAVFVSQNELNSFATTVSNTDASLSNSISAINSTLSNLNNIPGTLIVEKGGTSATNWYDAGYNLNAAVHSGNIGTVAGNRSDGWFACIRYNNMVRFYCRIIGSGSHYTCGSYIPEGYRPVYSARFPCVGINSNNAISYGAVYCNSDGSISVTLNSSTDAEVACEGWWTINY